MNFIFFFRTIALTITSNTLTSSFLSNNNLKILFDFTGLNHKGLQKQFLIESSLALVIIWNLAVISISPLMRTSSDWIQNLTISKMELYYDIAHPSPKNSTEQIYNRSTEQICNTLRLCFFGQISELWKNYLSLQNPQSGPN